MTWSVADAITSKHLRQRATLIELCEKHKDYPREANWVHALAREVEATKRTVVLEAPYWSAYKPRRSRGWPKADLWADAESPDAQLYTEVKIAYRRTSAPRSIGYNKPVAEILRWWANDIWRLMVGPHRDGVLEPVHSAFVVYTWGDAQLPREGAALAEIKGAATDADAIYDALCATEADPIDPVGAFVAECRKRFAVTVTDPFAVTSSSTMSVQAIVVEWMQRERARAADVEEWGTGMRSLA